MSARGIETFTRRWQVETLSTATSSLSGCAAASSAEGAIAVAESDMIHSRRKRPDSREGVDRGSGRLSGGIEERMHAMHETILHCPYQESG